MDTEHQPLLYHIGSNKYHLDQQRVVSLRQRGNRLLYYRSEKLEGCGDHLFIKISLLRFWIRAYCA